MSDAITITSDMKVYEAEFNSGAYEALAQNSNIFNAASRNGVMLITQVHEGNYLKKAYFKQISDLVTRQDITSVSAVDSLKLEQVEEAAVKCHRKIGPVQYSFKAFNMAGLQTPQGSMALGRLVGDAVLKNMASTAIMSAVAAVGAQTALIKDVTGESDKNATIKYLNLTRGLWGDQMTKLASWIMHSKAYLDLVDDGIDVELESVAGSMISKGGVGAFMGGGLVVSDNSSLYNSGSPTTYNVLGLAPMGVIIRQSELQNIVLKTITGLEQLTIEIQGEYAVSVGVDGYTWDVSNGGANPTDAYLATTDYWDKSRTDVVGLPIVKLLCQ